jgi:hypothetical protein
VVSAAHVLKVARKPVRRHQSGAVSNSGKSPALCGGPRVQATGKFVGVPSGAEGVDRRQSVARRELDDQFAMNRRQRARRHDQTGIRRARECRDGALDLIGIAHTDRAESDGALRVPL